MGLSDAYESRILLLSSLLSKSFLDVMMNVWAFNLVKMYTNLYEVLLLDML